MNRPSGLRRSKRKRIRLKKLKERLYVRPPLFSKRKYVTGPLETGPGAVNREPRTMQEILDEQKE